MYVLERKDGKFQAVQTYKDPLRGAGLARTRMTFGSLVERYLESIKGTHKASTVARNTFALHTWLTLIGKDTLIEKLPELEYRPRGRQAAHHARLAAHVGLHHVRPGLYAGRGGQKARPRREPDHQGYLRPRHEGGPGARPEEDQLLRGLIRIESLWTCPRPRWGIGHFLGIFGMRFLPDLAKMKRLGTKEFQAVSRPCKPLQGGMSAGEGT